VPPSSIRLLPMPWPRWSMTRPRCGRPRSCSRCSARARRRWGGCGRRQCGGQPAGRDGRGGHPGDEDAFAFELHRASLQVVGGKFGPCRRATPCPGTRTPLSARLFPDRSPSYVQSIPLQALPTAIGDRDRELLGQHRAHGSLVPTEEGRPAVRHRRLMPGTRSAGRERDQACPPRHSAEMSPGVMDLPHFAELGSRRGAWRCDLRGDWGSRCACCVGLHAPSGCS
jgi:hypothetical protein